MELSSGEVAVVVAEYRSRRLRPKVMVLLDADKNKLEKSLVVDLREESDSEEKPSLRIVKGLDPEAFGIDLSAIRF